MVLTGDFHTHSKYSRLGHGKDSIKDMVEEAKKKGLKSLAITDHGPKHILFPISKKNIDKARRIVDEINKTNDIKVYLGVEANLIKGDGTIDLSPEQIEKLDILLAGYHMASFADFVGFVNKNNTSTEQVQKNTQAYLNMLNKYNINIITHIQEHIKVDLKPIAELCAKKGTLIEINNKHLRLDANDAKILVESGCKLIVDSDAHSKDRIGVVDNAMQFILNNNIPLDRIVNIDKEYIPKR